MTSIRKALTLAALAATSTCTYGPPEDRSVAYSARIPSTRELVVLVHHERLRQPAGLRAFPDGGTAQVLLHEVRVYWVNAGTADLRRWAHLQVPESLWSAFDVGIAGVAADTVYVTLTGCGGAECTADLRERRIYRVTSDSAVSQVDQVPDRHRRGGESLAPMQGETDYLRVSDIQRDSLIVRLSYPGDTTTLFRITPAGELEPVLPARVGPELLRAVAVLPGDAHDQSSRPTLHAFRGT